MNKSTRRIAVLTSGGDAPGMNAAIRAVTLIGISQGVEVYGVERGYRGLLEGALSPLGAADVAGIIREGGTILGSARSKEFHAREARERARKVLAARGVEGLVVIGGNGSLTGALAISDPEEAGDQAVRVVGIPASIDNDIGLTGLAIGVDTAMNTIVEACDKIADTATAHDRMFIVEVMGRDCGYLAMTAAIASGAEVALFPEAGMSEGEIVDSVVHAVRQVLASGRRHLRVLCIKAEGVHLGADQLRERVDARLCELDMNQASLIETRVTVLGHVVRGGRPSAFDRLLGSRLANVAVRALLAGQTRKMAAWMPPIEIPADIGMRSEADPYCWLVDMSAAIAETEGLPAGETPLARWRAGVFNQLEEVFLP